MTSDVVFTEATLADAEAYYGGWPAVRFQGFVARRGDEVLALFGVYWHNSTPVAFSDLRPEAFRHRKAIARACRIMQDFCHSLGQPVYALPDARYASATYLLVKMGFLPTGQITPLGEYMKMEN